MVQLDILSIVDARILNLNQRVADKSGNPVALLALGLGPKYHHQL